MHLPFNVLVLSCTAVVSASKTPHLTVDVAASGNSYVVRLDGNPWLHSAALRFFVNGEWHGTVKSDARPIPICTAGTPNTDVATGSVCVTDDVEIFLA